MHEQDDVFYCYAVCVETVYNRVFGLLPIWPYALRRKVARRISDYLNVSQPPRKPKTLGDEGLTRQA